ncbi:MAG: DUF3185 domain-containing protein [Gammaproteobacteria bacterium]|nr:DUF3185 domain-containing protein [Gammaproteobacteria bacterium]
MNFKVFGMILIILGIVFLSYTGFTYKEREQVAEIGDLKLTTETPKRVNFPPMLGGLVLAVGIILVVVDRMGKK